MAFLKSSRRAPKRQIASIRDMILAVVHQGCSRCRSTVNVHNDQIVLGGASIKGRKQPRVIVPWACTCGKFGKTRFSPDLLSKKELAALIAAGNGSQQGAEGMR